MAQLPNPFLNSGTPPSTAVPDTAAADQVAPQVAAAAPFAVSDECAPSGTAVTAPVRTVAADEIQSSCCCEEVYPRYAPEKLGSVKSEVAIGQQETEAAASVRTAAASDNLGCLTAEDETLYWQLRHTDNPFTRDLAEIPDPHALFDAIEPPPLFLQRQA